MARPKRPVVVRLTIKEAEELLSACGNGYGDGDLYDRGYDPSPEKQEEEQTYISAENRLRLARDKAKDALEGRPRNG